MKANKSADDNLISQVANEAIDYIIAIEDNTTMSCAEIKSKAGLDTRCSRCFFNNIITDFDCSRDRQMNQLRKLTMIKWLKSIGRYEYSVNKQLEFEF